MRPIYEIAGEIRKEVTDYQIEESPDPVNYRWVDGKGLERLLEVSA